MDRAFSTYGKEQRCIEDVVVKLEGRRTLEKPRRRWEDNIKIDLRG
jgi:uncharacterized OsmC-like protein